LLLHGEPGSVVGAAELDWCRRDSAGLEIVNVGAGSHFLPEDQPEAISRALTAWLARLKKLVSPLRSATGRKEQGPAQPH
jgi:haloalkane dehalogenase